MRLKQEMQAASTLGDVIARAECLLEERQLRAAIATFDEAETRGADPDGCCAARWLASMLQGDFQAAWAQSDVIRQRGGDDPSRFWMGEDLQGKRVIARCLHGFGDAIQFLRYLPRLRALASEVIVEVPPRMLELAPMLDGVGELITWGAERLAPEPQWDVQVEVMELPYLFRTQLAELPIAVNYLRPPTADVDEATACMGRCRETLRLGLVWSAGEWNTTRSIPISCLEPLLRVSGAEFWSLQGGAAASEAQPWIDAGLMRDAAICGGGQRALAAVVANLDLVITVDTLAAHLAGAMGRPVWVLLQHAADWRWMTDRSDSPWYPRMRLFRQPASVAAWQETVDKVRAELLRLLDATGHGRV